MKVGDLVKTRFTDRVGVVLQQDNVAHPNETQIFVAGEKEWFQTKILSLISGKKVK